MFLEALVAAGVLPPNTDPAHPVWIAPGSETESITPSGYVVSLAWLHERGPQPFPPCALRHYEVELHNFAPNAISQAAVFVAICEGYLGVQAHWDLWRHLFRGELHTDSVSPG